MGNLGFQELFLIFIVLVVVIAVISAIVVVIVKAVSKRGTLNPAFTGNASFQGENTHQAATVNNDRGNLINQLSQLQSLKEKNVITDELYEQERQAVLDKLSKK